MLNPKLKTFHAPFQSRAGGGRPSNRLRRFASLLILAMLSGPGALWADDWPQWMGPRRDGIWREAGIVEKFPAGGPALRWRTPIGAGYSGPAVAGDRVYVTDRLLAPQTSGGGSGAPRGVIAGKERVLCLRESDGAILWQHEYDCPYDVAYPAGPRATPVVEGGRVYTLGTEGDLICFDAESGKIFWSHQFKKDFQVETPGWGFSAHPLLDGPRLICLVRGKGTTAVAFDKETGKVLWSALTAKEPGYSPPMIYSVGGVRQLIIWHPESVNSLNPETGELYWSEPFAVRSGLSVPTPRLYRDRLLVTSFYNGSMMLRLATDKPGATVLWRGKSSSERNTDGLHSIIATPFFDGEHVYGVCSYGQLRCLKADSGERLWETFQATTGGREVRWATAFIVKHQDRFFLANEHGDLIIARLRPEGYEELDRVHLLEPTNTSAGRNVVWSHPAFAHRSIYARNDQELVCYSLAKE